MGSSARTGKKIFQGSLEHFLDKNAIWDRTPPHLHINCSLHVLGRVQGSQIFKQNSIISICSKVMAFLVISLSLSSPHCPCHPHIMPVSTPLSPHHPHSPQKVPMWSPLPVVSMVSVVSVVSTPCCPHGPCHPHVIPMSSLSSPHHPHSPRRSPCGPHDLWSPWSPLSPWSPPHVVPMVPVVPTSSLSSLCHPHLPHII